MQYGCIGEHLKHSFSAEIHRELADYPYEILEVASDALDAFLQAREFCGINVTIPYKERVIPHLYWISEQAKQIGAVNTVVNRAGKLYGYNTDFYGMNALIEHLGYRIRLVECGGENLKITTQKDLALAEAILAHREKNK